MLERDPCLGHGPESAPLQEGAGCRGDALFHGAHTLMQNHSGLVVQVELTRQQPRRAQGAFEMINRHSPGSIRRLTLWADKGMRCRIRRRSQALS